MPSSSVAFYLDSMDRSNRPELQVRFHASLPRLPLPLMRCAADLWSGRVAARRLDGGSHRSYRVGIAIWKPRPKVPQSLGNGSAQPTGLEPRDPLSGCLYTAIKTICLAKRSIVRDIGQIVDSSLPDRDFRPVSLKSELCTSGVTRPQQTVSGHKPTCED